MSHLLTSAFRLAQFAVSTAFHELASQVAHTEAEGLQRDPTRGFAYRHLLFNMVALWSFGQEAARILGVEQFIAFYVSAGKPLQMLMATRVGLF